jgi:hypothetical protein
MHTYNHKYSYYNTHTPVKISRKLTKSQVRLFVLKSHQKIVNAALTKRAKEGQSHESKYAQKYLQERLCSLKFKES